MLICCTVELLPRFSGSKQLPVICSQILSQKSRRGVDGFSCQDVTKLCSHPELRILLQAHVETVSRFFQLCICGTHFLDNCQQEGARGWLLLSPGGQQSLPHGPAFSKPPEEKYLTLNPSHTWHLCSRVERQSALT